MSGRGRWIAVLVVLFAASFGAGAATSQTGEAPRADTAARPLGQPASARIDSLSTAPRLPALREPSRTGPSPKQTAPPPPPGTRDPSPQTAPPPPPGPGSVLPPEPVPE